MLVQTSEFEKNTPFSTRFMKSGGGRFLICIFYLCQKLVYVYLVETMHRHRPICTMCDEEARD